MGNRRLISWACALALCAAAAKPLAAQDVARTRPFDAATRARVLAEMKAAIRAHYVFPEKREPLIASLDAAQRDDGLAAPTPTAFADKITEVMQRSVGDKHLGLVFDPAWVASFAAEEADDSSSDFDRESIRDHFGIGRTELLPGNIRLLRISAFGWVNDRTGQAYDDVVRFLRDGDAIVIDIRGNTGGAHDAVRYLVSHFLEPDTRLYDFVSTRMPGFSSAALTHLPAGRIKGKPLFVLIDRRTRSAGEDLAYQVQQYRLGTLVGTRTAGAANNNEYFPVAGEYRFSLSVGRPIHPVSKGNWEGVGIVPSLPCPAHEALERAILAALDVLERNAEGPAIRRIEYDWARLDAATRLHPVVVPAATLENLAGRYGVYGVTLRDGRLWLESADRDPASLRPLGDNLFAVDGLPHLRIRFGTNSLSTHMLGSPDPLTYPRQR